jgi:hypothetical protein
MTGPRDATSAGDPVRRDGTAARAAVATDARAETVAIAADRDRKAGNVRDREALKVLASARGHGALTAATGTATASSVRPPRLCPS